LTPTVASLRAAGVLGPLDEHFAATVGRLAGEARPGVLVAAALASRQVSLGHVCLDLRQIGTLPALAGDEGDALGDLRALGADRWRELLRTSPLVAQASDAAATTPLVLDAHDRLYLRRYFDHEQRLAADLRARAGEEEPVGAAGDREATLERLFPAAPQERAQPRSGGARAQLELPMAAPPVQAGDGAQRRAAQTALARRLCVVSGGPGTGKTSTVVKILALLVEQARDAGRPVPRALLLAPTGKAAMRLTESIRREKAHLACDEAVRAAIPEETATIHRALGTIDGSTTRFRHHRESPLAADVVLVDEASMVDLALMARLVDAVPPEARLILLGDEDQLSSVEAGAVLGEVCAAADTPDAPLGPCVVRLTRSWRYRPGSGIEGLARAVNAGDAARALALLDDPAYPDVARVDPTPDGALSAALRATVLEGFRAYLDQGEPKPRLAALERFRLLCAHRQGPHGAESANREIEAVLAGEGRIDRGEGATYAGRPIIVTRNDYQLQLFNGDVGTIVLEDGRKLAFFLAPDGTPRRLSPARLPPHETVFAMTVHKSQGSEFDRVAVLLGDRPSPLGTRELLYTAVTRARHAVELHGTADLIAEAIRRRTARASGLRDALRG